MKVMVAGSGAREHALCWKIARSPHLSELLAAPGNPGMAEVARCFPTRAEDVNGIVQLARQERVDLVVVGPEDPLAAGMVDQLTEAGVLAFGPSAAAARIEASKSFAKDLMGRCGVPTARHEVVTTPEEALDALDRWTFPLVFKADGLARGRGVTIIEDRARAEQEIRRYLVDRTFGEGGGTLVLEEYLEGREVSLIGVSDGESIVVLQPAEDHKQLMDGDRGPNTGGMGCISPVPFFSAEDAHAAGVSILQRIVDSMGAEGTPFRGALFAGLMLTAQGPRVLEFNARFGDPEAETLFPRLKSDLLPLLHGSAAGRLPRTPLEWRSEAAVCVVLASQGYPGKFQSGKVIEGAWRNPSGVEDGPVLFHAGTAELDGQLVTSGGRVLAVTALGRDIETARSEAYAAADRITFEGVYRRSDIGARLTVTR